MSSEFPPPLSSSPPQKFGRNGHLNVEFREKSERISCPLPPKPGFGVRVWEGLSGGCSAGLTLKRYAANWLPSRFSLSAETRRRYGWLRMMVFPGARLFRAPNWCPSGGWRHARGREHCHGEPGSALSGGYAPDSAKKAESSSIVNELGES